MVTNWPCREENIMSTLLADAVSAATANGDLTLTGNGTGDVSIDGLIFPTADGSAGQFIKSDGAGALSFATVSVSNDYYEYADQRASGTAGTGYTINGWRTCTINTEVQDTASNGSVASNQVTLPAGSYVLNAVITIGQSNAGSTTIRARPRLYDATGSAVLFQGTSAAIDDGTSAQNNTVSLHGYFVLGTSSALEIQAYISGATTLAHTALSTGIVEEYLHALFTKVA